MTVEDPDSNTGYYDFQTTTLCGLNSIRMPDFTVDEISDSFTGYKCFTPESGNFLDWYKLESHGLVETSQCVEDPDEASFTELQKVLQAFTCDSSSNDITASSLGLSTDKFTSEKYHPEF